MDSLTHIVLGACIGEAIAGKQLGKKALLWGAIAQSLPDIDFVASFWLPTSYDLLAHRGITHSILFIAVLSPLIGLLSYRLDKRTNMSLAKWTIFWGLQMIVHIFIDAFNAYGTGWFEPFSHYRVSFDAIFVADPLFTLWPMVAALALLILKRGKPGRMMWAKAGIGLSAFYLFCCTAFKLMTETVVKAELSDLHVKRHFTTPTPLNNLLWYIVGETDSGFYTGYRSVLDKKTKTDFHFVYKNDSLLRNAGNKKDIANLQMFAKGYYSVEFWHDTLVFNNLRFGEIAGWDDPHPRFVFYYYLNDNADNKMVVQRGRFAKWDKAELTSFVHRIKGI